ncbi:MAG: hypothetical protein AB1547_09915, partial [Thermodesulfobacteriota bacterium]
ARSNDLRLLQTVSAASQNTTRPPAGGPALKEKRWLATFCGAIRIGYASKFLHLQRIDYNYLSI